MPQWTYMESTLSMIALPSACAALVDTVRRSGSGLVNETINIFGNSTELVDSCPFFLSCRRLQERKPLIRHICCNRIRRIHSKGAIIVLFWVFLAWTSFFFVGGSADSTGVQFIGNGLLNREGIDLTLLGKDIPLHCVCYATIAVVWVLGTPLAGWLADARFGRYKVMQVSLWIMWCGILTHSCLYLLPLDDDDQQSIGTNGVLVTLAPISTQ